MLKSVTQNPGNNLIWVSYVIIANLSISAGMVRFKLVSGEGTRCEIKINHYTSKFDLQSISVVTPFVNRDKDK